MEGGSGFDVFEIFSGGGEAFVADDLGEILGVAAAFELVGHESVPKIIDFGSFDAGGSEKSVDGGSNISD